MPSSRSPIVLPKPEFRRADRIAEECIAQCMATLGLTTPPLPIPVELWIEGPLRIRFEITDLSYLGDGVLGAAFVKDRAILISETLVNHEARYRFTCAHELGHILMHAKAVRPFYDADTTIADIRRVEAQANRFAASFLMPLGYLLVEMFAALESAGVDRIDGLTQLLQDQPRSRELWSRTVLPWVCSRFGVSKQAAVFRLASLRLRDRRPLLLPGVRQALSV